MALTGTETLFVLGQNPTGVPAASTFQTTTGAIADLAFNQTTPILAGATLAVDSTMAQSPILLNRASGSVVTLPAATGTGNTYSFVVSTTVTSNSHKVLAAASTDYMNGNAVGFTNSSGTCKAFSSAAATNHSIQMPAAGTNPSGGIIGDWFDVTDVATNLWTVRGNYAAGVTPTTPFSSSTT